MEKSELWGLEEVFRKQLGKTPVVQDLLRCTHLPLFQDEDSKAINAIKLLCLNILYICMIMYAQEQSQFVYLICISLGFYGLMLEITAAFGQ